MASHALGTLTLDMLVKMGAFQQGLDKAARVTDQRTKEMQRSLQALDDKASAIGAGLKSALNIAGGAALFGNFVTQTINAQNEQAQLSAVIKSTGGAAGQTVEQLNRMATAMSSVGGGSIFSEGEINQAQTRLLSYSNVLGEQYPAAMQSTIDMAARMNMSVTQAAETVGKALDVPTQGYSALTRLGFRFTDEQKKLIEQLEKTGQTAKAQQIIVDVLASSYGGAAKAARDTLGGALKALQDNLNNLFVDSSGGDQLKGYIEALNSGLSSDAAKTTATALLVTMQALVPAATAYLTLWGGVKFTSHIKSLVSARAATLDLARAELVAAEAAKLKAARNFETEVSNFNLVKSQEAQIALSGRIVAARNAEIAADTRLAAAKSGLTRASSAASVAVSALGGWMGVASLAVGVGALAFGSFQEKTIATKQTLLDLNQPLEAVVKQFGALSQAQKEAELSAMQNNQLAEIQKLSTATKDMGDAFAAAIVQMNPRAFHESQDEINKLVDLVSALKNTEMPADEWAKSFLYFSESLRRSTAFTEEQKNAIRASVPEMVRSRNELDTLRGATDGAAQSMNFFASTADTVKRALDGMSASSEASTKAFDGLMDRWAVGADKAAREGAKAAGEISAVAGGNATMEAALNAQYARYTANQGKRGGGRGAVDPLKRSLEMSIEGIKNTLDDYERSSARAFGNLERMREDNLIGASAFYNEQKRMLDEQTRAQAEAINKEIAAQNTYRASARKESEAYAATKRVNELRRQQINLIEEAADKQAEAFRNEAKDLQELQRLITGVNISWLEAQGKSAEAAMLKFDQQWENTVAKLRANGDFGTVRIIEDMREATEALERFKEAYKPAQGVLDTLQYSEQMLEVTQQLGGIGEIAALRQLGNLRADSLELLTASLRQLEAAMEGVAPTPEMLNQYNQLQLQIKQLEANIDPLGEKFASVFSDNMENPLYEFISGTKTAGEAFEDMANSIIADLARMAIQNSLAGLFGKGGKGGFGGFFGGLFANVKGGVYNSPGLSAYSNQVVSSPTLFPFAKGGNVGLMGEAGSEFIMPAVRTGDGSLGVKAIGEQFQKQAGGNAFNTSISVNVSSSGANSTTSSDSQDQNARGIAAALDQAVRERLSKEMMQGGLIWKMNNGR